LFYALQLGSSRITNACRDRRITPLANPPYVLDLNPNYFVIIAGQSPERPVRRLTGRSRKLAPPAMPFDVAFKQSC
jgi:hypothetical protein